MCAFFNSFTSFMHTRLFALLAVFLSILTDKSIKSSLLSFLSLLRDATHRYNHRVQLCVLCGWCLRLLLFLRSAQFPAKPHVSSGFKKEPSWNIQVLYIFKWALQLDVRGKWHRLNGSFGFLSRSHQVKSPQRALPKVVQNLEGDWQTLCLSHSNRPVRFFFFSCRLRRQR